MPFVPARSISFVVCYLIGLALSVSPASAQEWATKMVEKSDHDFGTVARGSDTIFKFELTNKYKESVNIKSVRSSCGCTAPSIQDAAGKIYQPGNLLLKTYEKGYVVAAFNTRTFTGIHSATLTVQLEFIDASGTRRPGQVQLRVHGDIRGDVVFEPGSLDFATVDQGTKHERMVKITYAGRSGWMIQDVRSASSDLEVELIETRRTGGSIAYNLVVRLKETAKPGLMKEQLALVTNDSRTPRIPLDVQGTVTPEISVAPATLVLGDVKAGESIKKRLIVRGKQPFRVTSISCGDDGCFEFSAPEEEKERHIIEVAFVAKEAGSLKRPIVITTSRGETFQATCMAYANVIAPPAPAVPAATGDGASTPPAPAANAAAAKEADGAIAQGN